MSSASSSSQCASNKHTSSGHQLSKHPVQPLSLKSVSSSQPGIISHQCISNFPQTLPPQHLPPPQSCKGCDQSIKHPGLTIPGVDPRPGRKRGGVKLQQSARIVAKQELQAAILSSSPQPWLLLLILLQSTASCKTWRGLTRGVVRGVSSAPHPPSSPSPDSWTCKSCSATSFSRLSTF